MNHDEHGLLVSEVGELESMLADLPEDFAFDRMGLEARLDRARGLVAGFDPGAAPRKARLTFRGRPVDGSRGLAADFAAKATGYFDETFSAVAAALDEKLNAMGPIPDRGRNRLLITGTAVGSFGFELELPRPEPAADGQGEFIATRRPAEQVMAGIEKLFETAAGGSDDELGEMVDEIHPRAVGKAAEFLRYLAEQEAWCGLDFEDRRFRFGGVAQVADSARRLEADNIRESVEEHAGEFQGALPKGRAFEFAVRGGDAVLKGKIGPGVDDPGTLARDLLFKPAIVTFQVVRVGQGRPRFTLASLDAIRVG